MNCLYAHTFRTVYCKACYIHMHGIRSPVNNGKLSSSSYIKPTHACYSPEEKYNWVNKHENISFNKYMQIITLMK